MMPCDSKPGLVDRLLSGDLRALARAATLVESDAPAGRTLVDRLYPRTGRAHVIGVTGPPGAGKSTLIDALIGEYRRGGQRIAAILIDPSSPLTGGAVLGDRIRIGGRSGDPNVFIRSMATRGRAGGLAPSTPGLIHLFDAAGFDPILVETVGVGQGEVDIASLAATTLLLQVPGLGDGIQTIKAGILEVGDIVAVNKADLPGADPLFHDLSTMLRNSSNENTWTPRIIRTNAIAGEGVPELIDALAAHRSFLQNSEAGRNQKVAMARSEVLAVVRRELERASPSPEMDKRGSTLPTLMEDVAERRKTPRQAAEALLDAMSATGD